MQKKEAIPENDSCTNAKEINSFPFTSSGDTTAASPENNSNIDPNGVALRSCGGHTYNGAPAVWYKVTGTTGTEMSVETLQPDPFDFFSVKFLILYYMLTLDTVDLSSVLMEMVINLEMIVIMED